jgi:quinol monooxygenase YgiN
MNEEVSLYFFAELKNGNFDKFKHLVNKIVSVTERETGSVSYIYSIGEDGKSIHIRETYKKEAVVHHITQSFGPYADEFMSYVDLKMLYVYGPVCDEAKELLAPFSPNYMVNFSGF